MACLATCVLLLSLQMLGSKDKRYVCLGPASGFADHYGALHDNRA